MLNKFIRGSVWWCEFKANKAYRNEVDTNCIIGRRPCVIISATDQNGKRGTVTVIPSSTKDRHSEETVKLRPLSKDSNFVVSQITTVDSKSLDNFEGILTDDEVETLDRRLLAFLGIPTVDIEEESCLSETPLMDPEPAFESVEEEEPTKVQLNSAFRKKKKYDGMNAIEKFNARYGVSESVSDKVEEETSKKRIRTNRRAWSTEDFKNLIEDRKTMKLNCLGQKYGVSVSAVNKALVRARAMRDKGLF